MIDAEEYTRKTFEERLFRHEWREVEEGSYGCTLCGIIAVGPDFRTLIENYTRPCSPRTEGGRVLTLTIDIGGCRGQQTLQVAWLPDITDDLMTFNGLEVEAEWVGAVTQRLIDERVVRVAVVKALQDVKARTPDMPKRTRR